MRTAFVLLSFLSATFIGKAHHGFDYEQPNIHKLDSVLKKELGYETGKYWNTIWSRYYALDDFKGLRSIYNPNVVLYDLYSKGFPLVLINDIPLVFYHIGDIQFTNISSAIYTDSFSIAAKKAYQYLKHGVLSIEADIKPYKSSTLDLKDIYAIKQNIACSPVGLTSFLDSALLAAVKLNRNQCYNKYIYDKFIFSIQKNHIPLLYPNSLGQGELFYPRLFTVGDTLYKIYVNKIFSFNYFDDNLWSSSVSNMKKGIVTNVKKTVERAANPERKLPAIVRVDITAE